MCPKTVAALPRFRTVSSKYSTLVSDPNILMANEKYIAEYFKPGKLLRDVSLDETYHIMDVGIGVFTLVGVDVLRSTTDFRLIPGVGITTLKAPSSWLLSDVYVVEEPND